MAPRFLASVRRQRHGGDPLDARRMGTLGLAPAVETDRMTVWTNGTARMIASQSGRVHVLGRLFTRSDRPSRVAALDRSADRHADVLDLLTRSYWGQYIAFSQCTLGSVQVYRDPSGSIPCYVREATDHVFLFSDIDLAVAAGLVEPEIDFDAMANFLARPALRRPQTVLWDIYEIPQGWVLGIAGSKHCALRQKWNPWEHVQPRPIEGTAQSELLRSTVTNTVRALAHEFERVQLCLSGGLDSSIVAAALNGTDTICLNLVSSGPEGDERAQARLVADHVGLDLVDRRYRLDDIDITRSSAIHLPRPVGSPGRQAFDRANFRLAAEHSADALFTGNGGDNVFCFMPSAAPIADRLKVPGSRIAACRTLADICELTGCSVWTAISRAARKLPASAARYRWRADARFLNPELEALTAAEQMDHPWLDAPRGALPGKAGHIAALMMPQNFSEGFARTAQLEMVTPLLAQPIVELCLSIQSWRWVEGGRDRSAARDAFRALLPQAISERRTKGGPGAFYRQIVEHDRKKIMEILLDGELSGRKLIDRAAIEAFFRQPMDTQGADYVRILTLCDAESWVRHRLA